jgi:Uma2 family endonuclease
MSLIQEPKVHRFTRDEYRAMADAGLFQDQRVELIEGEIIDMAPQNNPHMVAIGLTQRALTRAFPESSFWIRIQGPLHLGTDNEPEPDLVIVPGTPRDYQDHPTSALLIVEVSESTLSFDRTRKSRLYAEAGIADYWILNLVDRQLEVCRNPRQDSAKTWSYADTRTLTPADTISPLAAPTASIRVADLLP